jgi:hypothetical protein
MGRLRLGRRLPAVVPDRRDVKAVSGRGAILPETALVSMSARRRLSGLSASQPVLASDAPTPSQATWRTMQGLIHCKESTPNSSRSPTKLPCCRAEVLKCLQRGSNLVANCSNSSPGSLGLLLRRDGGRGWSRPGRPSAGRRGRGPFRLEPRGPRPDCSGRCRVWDPALWPGL